MTKRAVVFAYHNVGVRCLKVLLAHGVEVVTVVTHEDNPQETVWFGSVADTAHEYGIPVITPHDPNADEVVAQLASLQPDFLFSFYYRQMLQASLLQLPREGAFNMHGSLLPKYRGRAPVNWAILHGERTTGATLHEMEIKPDAGAILAQTAVPILPDDDAKEVFDKVTLAAEIALHQVLPALLAGTAKRQAQELAQGSYFGGRKPEDGRIRWMYNAQSVHNLVRAVAPPYYPGAFFDLDGQRICLWKTRVLADMVPTGAPGMFVRNNRLLIDCVDGVLQVLYAEIDGAPLDAERFTALFAARKIFFDLS